MEVTLIGGWTNSDGDDKLDLDNFYFGLRSGYATNLPKAKAIITLDNARIGSIQTGTVDMDIVLKNNNEMAGLYYSKFESFLIDNGHTVSIQGNGTLKLANDSYDGNDGPRAYSTAGGVLNFQHGITVSNLENMTFENIKVTYTRTFDRVIKILQELLDMVGKRWLYRLMYFVLRMQTDARCHGLHQQKLVISGWVR